ncbi:MAG TPA: glutathione S-transferase [Polyangiaceae bacterium]
MTSKLRLYGFKLSGHTHRAELFLSILGLPFEKIEVDVLKGAHKQPEFLAMNPLGQVPVLQDGDWTIADSNAILVYLALEYDTSRQWYPLDARRAARVQRWLSIAAGELREGPGAARLVRLLGAKLDHERAKSIAATLYGVVDRELASTPYLACATPTIADLALYSYTAVATEGDVSLEPWPNVRAWLARIESIERFVAMPQSSSA